MAFFDANYNITKLEKSGGKITKLELNGQEVPLTSDLDNNKAATIDVSTYTAPVEITPTSGKDGMKKATVTLSNIPAGIAKLISWKYTDIDEYDYYCYTLTSVPVVGGLVLIGGGELGEGRAEIEVDTVASFNDDELVLTNGSTVSADEKYTRYEDGDISLS